MFLERKIQNLFFLIFIIILFWVTPLYLVKANQVVKIPKFKEISSLTINSKLTNTTKLLLLPLPNAKLTFDIFDLDNIEKTKEERKYFYKLTFEDNNLSKELVKNQQTLKDKSFVCHLNTSIFDSDNNPLTDLFDIKCSYRKSDTGDSFKDLFEFESKSQTFYEIDMYKKRLERQKREFSFFKMDLKEWAYDIQIEIKTKSENYTKYEKLENEKKKIKLKCELDITDKDNYPIYLFNIFDKFQNTSFKNISKTNYDFDFISNSDPKILSNSIWLVFKKNNEFLIWDLIINQEVKYKEYKTYQDLMNLYHSSYSSWKKEIENKIDNKFESNLKRLNSEVEKKDKENKNYEKLKSDLEVQIRFKKEELTNLNSQLEKNILKQAKTKKEYELCLEKHEECKKEKEDEIKKKLENVSKKDEKQIQRQVEKKFELKLKSLKSEVDKKYKENKKYENSKSNLEVKQEILSLIQNINFKKEELTNLNSQLKENILKQEKTKKEYELCLEKHKECKKEKEDKIKTELSSNNVSRIKLCFLKEIYEIDNSYTHSSLHLKQDWDIGEIKYDGGDSNEVTNNFIIGTKITFEKSGGSIETKTLETKEIYDQSENQWKQTLSNEEEYSEIINEIDKENLDKVENTYGKEFGEHLKNKYTSIGNKKIKELQQVKETKEDYMKIKIRINEDYMKKNKINSDVIFSHNSNFFPQQIHNKKVRKR